MCYAGRCKQSNYTGKEKIMEAGYNIKVVVTGWFAGMALWVNWLDFSYADSALIQPLQHLFSLACSIVSLIVGLPVAAQVLNRIWNYIKSTLKR